MEPVNKKENSTYVEVSKVSVVSAIHAHRSYPNSILKRDIADGERGK